MILIKKPVFVSIVLFAMLLSSCQLKQTPVVEDTKNYTQATLHIAYYDSGLTTGAPYAAGQLGILRKIHPIEERIVKFLENYPNVTVYISTVSTDHRIQRYFSDDYQLPDIIEINPNHARFLVQDRLTDLDLYYDDDMRLWESYNQLIDTTRINDKFLTIPISGEPLIALYNRSLFEQLGLPLPSEDWTWDDFEDIANQLKNRGYLSTISDSFNLIEPIIQSLGGQYAGKDPGEVNSYLNSPATIAAFEKLFRLPLDFDYYREGKTGIHFTIPSNILFVESVDKTAKFGVVPLPRAMDGTSYNTLFPTGLAISKSTEHPDLAWKLVRSIIGDNDEEAMQFLVNNTLRRFQLRMVGYSESLPKNIDEVRQIMLKNYVSAKPSTFFTQLHPFNNMPDFVPGQSALKEMRNGADVAATLEKYTEIIEKGFPLVFMK